jgi:hypothetical protein
MADSDAGRTWNEAEEAQYARRVAELHLEGHEEFEVETIAADEVNAERNRELP